MLNNYLEQNIEENLDHVFKIIDDHKIHEDDSEIKLLFRLLVNISDNHYRSADFFNKIEKIILKFENSIKQFFSNFDIFEIFESNNRLLIFLIEHNLLTFDKNIFNEILHLPSKKISYFMPEISKYINEQLDSQEKNKYEQILKTSNIKKSYSILSYDKQYKTKNNSSIETEIYKKIDKNLYQKAANNELSEEFYKNRIKGENENFICELIRNDSIEEFITFVNKNDYPLNSLIETSIFETNSFLNERSSSSLIEYAAFFGSVQIFKYLYKNEVKIEPSIWCFAVHSDNPELIDILEEEFCIKSNNKKRAKMEKKMERFPYRQSIVYSIRYHNNDVKNYIEDKYIEEKSKQPWNYLLTDEYDKIILTFSFQYYNFAYFPEDINNKNNIFINSCIYDYTKIVKLLLNNTVIDIYKVKVNVLQ